MAQNFDEMINGLYSHTVPVISDDEVKRLMTQEDIVILDIRSQEEYDVSHIKGAVFQDYDDFDAKNVVLEIAKDKKVIVYCSVGYRSEKAGEELKEAGYGEVFNLYGGIFEWVNNGNEVVDNKNTVTDKVHTYNKRWSKWLEKGEKVYD